MAKGGGYERVVAKQLSYWWCGNEDETIFWRSSGSGARATVRRKAGRKDKVHCGDLCAADPSGQPLIDLAAIEIKRGYNQDSIHTMLDKPPRFKQTAYDKWFAQAIAAQEQSGSFSWMLITKRDQREPLLFVPEDLMAQIEDIAGFVIPGSFALFHFKDSGLDISCCPFETFLASITPAIIRKVVKRVKK